MNEDKKALYFIRKIDETGRVIIPRTARQLYNLQTGDSLEIICDRDQIILKKHRVQEYFKASAEKIIEGFFMATGTPVVLCDRNRILFQQGLEDIQCKELSDDFFEQIRREDAAVYKNIALNEDASVKIKDFCFIMHSEECIGALIIPDSDEEIKEADKIALKVCASAIAAYVY